MSGMVTKPVEKTIALGGVATGRQKANDVATAVEIIMYRGWRPTEVACKTRPEALTLISSLCTCILSLLLLSSILYSGLLKSRSEKITICSDFSFNY